MPGDDTLNAEQRRRDMLLVHEYVHADTGRGLRAAHQIGWTGLIANLVMRPYRQEIPRLWMRAAAGRANDRV
jgi:hypothetical protein